MINLPENLYNQLVYLLSAQREVEKVILFGSRARGDTEERSDIDLAIMAPAASPRQWLDIVFLLEQVDTLLPLDVVRWEEASTPLQQHILTEGIILYERETEPEPNQS
ncbi:MAG: nucleotidyltransferase domain-containing protein [Chloroflexi bacterium]|nr:nucleotidyltransferase domain-containing protein [Chloroflexota bacterium]